MAQQAGTRNRPLSPHLQIWRWGPGMVSSILHRATGVGASVGILVLLWWLGALISGPEAYADFTAAATHPIGIIVLVGVSYSVIAHTITGIRHFVLDTGAGYELGQNKLWANISTVAGVVLTVLFWAVLLLR
ncbi:succinate dehydrogenase, cytochrome b556 subunit [Novosphingobium sp. M1R2S20]|uniref:Succinate dehydrogenase cytochrome b556 subunit n=1 Tax=Novosphingobium rhizovicinum TaxID=3228928 RepID=A0ABV3RDZ2_9SPHN